MKGGLLGKAEKQQTQEWKTIWHGKSKSSLFSFKMK